MSADEVYAILLGLIRRGGATPEQIQQAINTYLDINGIKVKNVDGGTFKDWYDATILMKRGVEADYDESKMLTGEPAVTTDTQRVFFGTGPGKAVELARKKDLENIKITTDSKLDKTSTNPVQNKVVAEEFGKLSEQIDEFYSEIKLDWEIGGLASSSGNNATSTTRMRTMKYHIDTFDKVEIDDEYKVAWYAYDNNSKFLGWTGQWLYTGFDMLDVIKAQPTVKFVKLIFAHANDAQISLDTDIEHIKVLTTASRIVENFEDKYHLQDINNILFETILWSQGGLYSVNGEETATTTRLRTEYFKLDNFLYTQINEEFEIAWYGYDEKYYFIASSGWKKQIYRQEILDSSPNIKNVRFLLRFPIDGVITPSVVTDENAKIIVEKSNSASSGTTLINKTNTIFRNGTIISGNGAESLGVPNRVLSDNIRVEWSNIYVFGDFGISIRYYDENNLYLGCTDPTIWFSGNISVTSHMPDNTVTYRIVIRKNNDSGIPAETTDIYSNVIIYKPNVLSHKLFMDTGENKFDYKNCGLPVLYMNGNTSAMTKDNAVKLTYIYGNLSGTCTCKWQGSSSVRLGYPKRNYTIKFDQAFEAQAGWGVQNKYCMKANWIDPSATRNVVNARLWGQVVASRTNINATLKSSPNYGAIDGFPIIIVINDEFIGLYTFNIPKDGWLFGMGNGDAEYLLAAESNSEQACLFKGTALCNETDFSIEYLPDGVEESEVVASFNTLLDLAISANENWEDELAPYLDIDSVVDYFIFINCIGGHDNLGKNILYGTYDGTKWFMSAYDLDTTYGSNPYGTEWFKVINDRNQFAQSATMHRLAYLLYTHSPERLKARYEELRSTVLSDENVWYTLTNFATQIPKGLYNLDADKWSTMPGTSMANVATYMDFYQMHCAYLDKEVNAM